MPVTLFVLAVLLQGSDYAVVASEATLKDWAPVVEALKKKHGATLITYRDAVADARKGLAAAFPKYACFVEPLPNRAFVVAVHRLMRSLDDDPYTDAVWGIVTGYDAAAALRVAETKDPLVVRRGAAGCGLPLEVVVEGAWWSEGKKNEMWEKARGGAIEKKRCDDDTTSAIVAELNAGKTDLFMTSGHATERDWQIGYSYPNGQFRCADGKLFGLDLARRRHPIDSSNPKVYLALGNCLMGHVPDRDAMALAWMNSGGVRQMVGYSVSTWFGYGGWGTGDYFFRLGGRYTLAESFMLNNVALVHQLETRFPKTARAAIDEYGIETDPDLPNKIARTLGVRERDELGLLWDRDTVAFYGDPAWAARIEKVADAGYEQKLEEKEGAWAFTVTSNVDGTWLRPAIAFLPARVSDARLTSGSALVLDNLVLMPPPEKAAKGQSFVATFTARRR